MKDTKENRIKFLKENNAFEAFKRNIFYFGDRTVSDALNPESSEGFIKAPFIWSSTPEGMLYWRDLNRKWQENIK